MQLGCPEIWHPHTEGTRDTCDEGINQLKRRSSHSLLIHQQLLSLPRGAPLDWARDVDASAPGPQTRPAAAHAAGARPARAPTERREGGAGDSIPWARGPSAAASIPQGRGRSEGSRATPGGRGRKGPMREHQPPAPASGPKEIRSSLDTHRRFSSSKLRTSRGRRSSPSRFFFLLRPIAARPPAARFQHASETSGCIFLSLSGTCRTYAPQFRCSGPAF